MKLTDHEKSMLDGAQGRAKARAMDLLVRYGEALGAERLVETNNVAGAFNASTPSVSELARKGFDAVYSELNLDSSEVVEVPRMVANTCQLITGIDNEQWRVQGIPWDLAEQQKRGEQYFGSRGINMFATCTPYQVGNVPVKGEHCAWMESSAVVYCNSVLGARTNTEGKESTGAAALTGRIPYWGYHIAGNRHGSHLVDVAVDVDDIMDWGFARLLSRRGHRRRDPGLERTLPPAEPDQAQAFRRSRGVIRRRRDVSSSRRDAGGAVARGSLWRQPCQGDGSLWRSGTPHRL
jgi:predicted aconitase